MDPDQTAPIGSTLFVKEASKVPVENKNILFVMSASRVNTCEVSDIRQDFHEMHAR